MTDASTGTPPSSPAPTDDPGGVPGQPVGVGIDVGGTKLVAGAVTADGRLVSHRRRTSPRGDLDALVAGVAELHGELGHHLPLGLAIAGLITRTGTFTYGPNLGLPVADLGGQVAAAVGRSVEIINDATAATLAEWRVGAAVGVEDVLVFTLGTGVGGGVVAGGRLVHGANGFGGELGHVIVSGGGRRCPCGNLGCLEAYASGTAIGMAASARLAAGERSEVLGVGPVDGSAVTQAAEQGDEVARSVLREAGRWLGIGAAGLVNALDPGIVVVGGGAMTRSAPFLLPAAVEALGSHLLGRGRREPPPLVPAALADDAGIIGAALLAADAAGKEHGA